MQNVKLAVMAMGSRFELMLRGEDPRRLRAAGEEAIAEIRGLDARLSFYRPTSQIGRLNRTAATSEVRVSARLFTLLQTAKAVWKMTDGAFDVTIGPLMRVWGLTGKHGRVPAADELAAAVDRSGMHRVRLDEDSRTVSFSRPGVEIDLGAIGKGYALDEAMTVLREAGVEHAILHCGTSTVSAVGDSPSGSGWTVAVAATKDESNEVAKEKPLAVTTLNDECLSVSAVQGKSFVSGGLRYGHVLDPRTGRPVTGCELAAVRCRTATLADALSTALLVLGEGGLELIGDRFGASALTVGRPDGDARQVGTAFEFPAVEPAPHIPHTQ